MPAGRWCWSGLLGVVTGLVALAAPLAAQENGQVRLEIQLSQSSARPGSPEPVVFTRNLLEDTPWLATLREGLPVRLQYRLELWRSREGWFDVLDRQLEWTVVIRHEPLLDQFSVVRLLPPNQARQNRYATPGGLASALGSGIQFQIAPRDAGNYYYAASLSVATLSDSDLDAFERVLRGEIDADGSGGGGLAQRARRLVLRLAGLPALSLSTRSESFEVK